MKTNWNGHVLRNLTNRVIAVIDDPRQTQAALTRLEQAGIGNRDLAALSGEEGVRQIDAAGAHSGGVTHVLRGLQRWTVEGTHLRKYQAELTQGHQVVDVHIHGRQNQDAVARILRAYGAHFINAYRQWTIEAIAA
jgi:hypothetical protein